MQFFCSTHALVALGSNQSFGENSPKQIVLLAIAELVKAGFGVENVSKLYATPCFPAGSGPDYVNACVKIALPQPMQPTAILGILHKIEADFGRARAARWGARTLDLDLVAADDLIFPDQQTQTQWQNLSLAEQQVCAPTALILPHPRLQDRAFVLTPLADIAPDWCHPVLGLTVVQMLAARPQAEREAVRQIL
jgi:2-amino-4-hydroxy-6-hydroxymethyldihydropteridine diphosphokinase